MQNSKKTDKNHGNRPDYIRVRGACQNNLKDVDIDLPLNAVTVVTGVSGSGKSSLVFDTIYAEGQRRYVETFSAYARQFLERMDKPRAERVDGVPPAIAIDQNNPVKTSRSTVGTMTELNDHIKLLFARVAELYCGECGTHVQRDTPQSVFETIRELDGFEESENNERPPQSKDSPLAGFLITFPVEIPENFSREETEKLLKQQGYTRIHETSDTKLEVVQDRLPVSSATQERLIDDFESGFHHGRGHVTVHLLDQSRTPFDTRHFSSGLHCPYCNTEYRDPVPNLFSFNSPYGACETCRGFGRVMGIDYELVIPDTTKSLEDGAVRPWQSGAYLQCQEDLLFFAEQRGIPTDVPWQDLSEEEQRWVIEGEGDWIEDAWYGIQRFFNWLESKSYRMHIRVLLSRYRAYRICPDCHGARLKPEALLWRLVSEDADTKGYTIHEIMQLPLAQCYEFFASLQLGEPMHEATKMLLDEIRDRLQYLLGVGLDYLTLDRQSRTLSGGEVQRINLTTALGTSLVNTLFVLDEPSIGLHPRDIQRLVRILHRLREAGNTLLVVEHDPQVIKAADFVLDLGPGPGERGGRINFFGTLTEFLSRNDSATAQYLNGTRDVQNEIPTHTSPQADAEERIQIVDAKEHNLRDITADIPLHKLSCVTGVSGSGKSTLIQDTCYNALRKLKHQPAEHPGSHDAIYGSEKIDDVIMVDQSPIGKSTRSSPASYVGALDPIRKMFAKEPLARDRGYTAGTFSFNSPKGQCPTCKGNGFEHVEMQFLSDVYIRCPDCDGARYCPEILEVKLTPPDEKASKKDSSDIDPPTHKTPRSIAGILELTVSEACEYFAGLPAVLNRLAPLQEVGLDYIKLGQPVPTLSGGEAQRLKLAGHLAEHAGKKRRNTVHNLFMFDEPTTGLHFQDISTLLQAFRSLVNAGHTVVVIEHNTDIMRGADWILDLGPEGGKKGGRIMCEGPPATIQEHHETSYTGQALNGAFDTTTRLPEQTYEAQSVAEVSDAITPADQQSIEIRHAREHNLKDTDISIPRNTFVVITGISGSGKSTVAFDILFGEGQRRYLESMNAYARQIVQPASRPEVDTITGIPPTVAIEQRSGRGGYKSTVATVTELYHFIRLLFVKLGTQYCPDCDEPIQTQTEEEIIQRILQTYRGNKIYVLAPLVVGRKGYYTDLAEWAGRKGFTQLRVDGTFCDTANWPRLERYKEHDIELPLGETKARAANTDTIRTLLHAALEHGEGIVYIAPASYRSKKPEQLFSTARSCPECGKSFGELDPRMFSFHSKHGWCPECHGQGTLDDVDIPDDNTSDFPETELICPRCNGKRLKDEALAVRFRNRNIAYITAMSVQEAEEYFNSLELDQKEAQIAQDMRAELRLRLQFLTEVGLPYLTLERAAPTLSGGETQRIRLASQLGSNLQGVCYILDEPTIGLHARDNRLLLDTLKKLEEKGNTVIVVEHDEDTIRSAEHIIDLGPEAGVNGGRLVAQGDVKQIESTNASVTGRCLKNPLTHPLVQESRGDSDHHVEVQGADMHNLKDIDVQLPLGRLICVTGVSGSGKSTLVRGVLYRNLYNHLRQSGKGKKSRTSKKSRISLEETEGCASIEGWEVLKRVLEVDQKPIGKTPRSCPATYAGIYDKIRNLFAQTPEAAMRGFSAGRFSFNVKDGRCPDCDGQGIQTVSMNFLPDVTVNCDRCNGQRFTRETLAVTYKDKTIADILAMSVDEAVQFFDAHPSINRTLQLLQEVGLGYLTLGQQSPTLSGGEAQRLKLVTELAKARGSDTSVKDKTLYLLEEPTIGLHMADVEKLIRVLHRLVASGNTVIIIEHNLDIIAEADWILDLGPEGGDEGGRVVAEGPPTHISEQKQNSHTGEILNEFLEKRRKT